MVNFCGIEALGWGQRTGNVNVFSRCWCNASTRASRLRINASASLGQFFTMKYFVSTCMDWLLHGFTDVGLVSTPDACEGGGDLLLHPLDELPIPLHQPLLRLDLGDDLLLLGEGREGDFLLAHKREICH